MSTTPTRKRVRAIEGGKTAAAVEAPLELRRLAADHYRANEEANAAANVAKKARSALYAGMKEKGLTDFSFATTIHGNRINLTSKIDAGRSSTVIDVEKLSKLVDAETFLKVVSATVTAVTTHCGTEIVRQCGEVKVGTENVSVKPTK